MLIQTPAGALLYKYQGTPSDKDLEFINTIEAQAGIDLKSYLVDQDGITRFDENSSIKEIGSSPRHTRSCY